MEVLKIHLFGGHLAQKSTCSKKKNKKNKQTWEWEKFHTITQLVEHPEELQKQRAVANVRAMEEGDADARTCWPNGSYFNK